MSSRQRSITRSQRSQSQLSKTLRSIGRSVGLVENHKYKTIKNINELTLNNVSKIKPNDIKFKSINSAKITNPQIKKRFERLLALKLMGLGHRSPKKTLKSMNEENNISLAPRSLTRYEDNSNKMRNSSKLRNLQIKSLEKRLKNLHGPIITPEEFEARLKKLKNVEHI